MCKVGIKKGSLFESAHDQLFNVISITQWEKIRVFANAARIGFQGNRRMVQPDRGARELFSCK